MRTQPFGPTGMITKYKSFTLHARLVERIRRERMAAAEGELNFVL